MKPTTRELEGFAQAIDALRGIVESDDHNARLYGRDLEAAKRLYRKLTASK